MANNIPDHFTITTMEGEIIAVYNPDREFSYKVSAVDAKNILQALTNLDIEADENGFVQLAIVRPKELKYA